MTMRAWGRHINPLREIVKNEGREIESQDWTELAEDNQTLSLRFRIAEFNPINQSRNIFVFAL